MGVVTHRATEAEHIHTRDLSLSVVAAVVDLLGRSIAIVEAVATEFGAQCDSPSAKPRADAVAVSLCPAHRAAAGNRKAAAKSLDAIGNEAVLTARQLDVLRALAAGHSNREIARKLGISEKTVKNHMQAIFVRLDVADRTQAALVAVRDELVRLAATPGPARRPASRSVAGTAQAE